jgi:hypothetical protein
MMSISIDASTTMIGYSIWDEDKLIKYGKLAPTIKDLELKALSNLEDVHIAQIKNYLVAYNLPIGLLINFGANSLQYKKIYNNKFVSES